MADVGAMHGMADVWHGDDSARAWECWQASCPRQRQLVTGLLVWAGAGPHLGLQHLLLLIVP